LGEVGPLPAEQVLHVLVALFEVIHKLLNHGATSGLLPSPLPAEVRPAWRKIVAASQSWPSASRSRDQVSQLVSAGSAPSPSAQRTTSSLLRTSSPSTNRMLPALMGSAGPSGSDLLDLVAGRAAAG